MTHRFTIDDFTESLSGKRPDFEVALEKAGDLVAFVDQILANAIAEIAEGPPSPPRRAKAPKKKIRRGVGSY